jgi:hypothetical protein
MLVVLGTGAEVQLELVLRIRATNSRRPLPEPSANNNSPTTHAPLSPLHHSDVMSTSSTSSPALGRRAVVAGSDRRGLGMSLGPAPAPDDMVRVCVVLLFLTFLIGENLCRIPLQRPLCFTLRRWKHYVDETHPLTQITEMNF